MFTRQTTIGVIEVRETMDTLKRLVTLCAMVLAATAGTALAQLRPSEAEQMKGRQQMALMETVLQQAVFAGAQNVVAQVRSIINAPPRLGTPRASGPSAPNISSQSCIAQRKTARKRASATAPGASALRKRQRTCV